MNEEVARKTARERLFNVIVHRDAYRDGEIMEMIDDAIMLIVRVSAGVRPVSGSKGWDDALVAVSVTIDELEEDACPCGKEVLERLKKRIGRLYS